MSKTIKQSEVAEHKTPESMWITIDDDVYDVTKVRSMPCEAVVDPLLMMRPVRGGAPRRKEDPAEGRWKGRHEAVLEVPQRVRLYPPVARRCLF